MLKNLFLLMFVFIVSICNIHAHAINYALAGAPGSQVFGYYARLGFHHILPAGIDHILFVVALCIGATSFKKIVAQVSAFTLAHTVTLILSMQNILEVPSTIVEPLIALSIICLAAENYWMPSNRNWRVLLVFVFGLLHGMGFAGALNETGLPPDRFYTALISFNAGVELGQLVIVAALILIYELINRKAKAAIAPIKMIANAVIAIVATGWFFERLFA